MTKRSKLIFLVVMILLFLSLGFINLKANGQSDVKMVEGASIRITGEQGLKFSATYSLDYINSDERGFYVIYGTATVADLTAALQQENPLINGKTYKQASEYDKVTPMISVVLIGIPEEGYEKEITVIAYAKNNGVYTYVPTVVTRSIVDVARAIYNIQPDEYQGELKTLVDEIATTRKIKHIQADGTFNYYNKLNFALSDGDTVNLLRGEYDEFLLVNADNVKVYGAEGIPYFYVGEVENLKTYSTLGVEYDFMTNFEDEGIYVLENEVWGMPQNKVAALQNDGQLVLCGDGIYRLYYIIDVNVKEGDLVFRMKPDFSHTKETVIKDSTTQFNVYFRPTDEVFTQLEGNHIYVFKSEGNWYQSKIEYQDIFTFVSGIITEYKGSSSEVVIPSKIGGVDVIGLGEELFSENETITSIYIPKGVKTIGDEAFYNAIYLEEVVFEVGSNLESIGVKAFEATWALESISLPLGLTEIGEGAFAASGLTSISLPAGIEVLAEGVFADCQGFTTLTIPATVSEIGTFALFNLVGLEEIVIESSNVVFNELAFAYEGDLEDKGFLAAYQETGAGRYILDNDVWVFDTP